MTAPIPLFEVSQVSKRFGRHVVLRTVDFQLQAGESVALLGANGAGKTTLLRILATLSRPTRGEYRAFGVSGWDARRQVRSRIGVVGHQPFVYPELTCRENLRFYATMYSVNDPDEAIVTALERVGLTDRANSRAGTLSRGLLQRLDLARAVLHRPSALVLDEPDTGLDAAGRGVLQRITAEQVERGGGVVFTTHGVEFALRLANRVVVLRGGDVALDAAAGDVTLGEVEGAIASAPAVLVS